MLPSVWSFTACIVLLTMSSAAKDEEDENMTPKEVYDSLSSRLDNIAFDIRLFRKDIAKCDTRIDDLEKKIGDIILGTKSTEQSAGTKPCVLNHTNERIYLEVKRQARLVHNVLATEKKLVREMGEQFENKWKDIITVSQSVNSINKSCEEIRNGTLEFESSMLNKISGIERKIESVETSVINGEKGDQGEKGSSGIPGQAGTPGKEGPRGTQGMPGPSGPPGLHGRKGEMGNLGLPGRKGERGNPGLPGRKGERGNQGLPGRKGEKGNQGLPGPLSEPDRSERYPFRSPRPYQPERYDVPEWQYG